MSFSLKDFKEGSYVSKILTPGEHFCRVVDLKLEKPPYDANAYNLVFVLEGEDLGEEFEGLPIDRLNPARGNYKGQIASVKASQFAYKDWNYKGKDISRDQSIQTFLGTFLKQVGLLEKVQALDISADTIEDFVAEIKSFLTDKNNDFRFYFTIAGQKYYKEGYDTPNYSLYLPKKTDGKYGFAASQESSSFLKFNEAEHITERKSDGDATPVSEFSAPSDSLFTTPVTEIPPTETLFQDNVSDLQLP